jgi:anti-sigma-K factor RskA
MPDEAHVFDLLPAYALGALDEDDADQVASHLAGCALCRAELGSFEAVVEQLASSVPAASPPPNLKRRLMDRVHSLRPAQPARPLAARPPLMQRLLPVWGAVSLLLIVALAAANLLLWQRISNLEVLTGPLGMRAVALHNNAEAAPQASGFVIISADGQNGVLVVDALPVLDPAQQYQAWLMRDGQSTPGPAFSVDESGYRGARIEAPESLLSYTEILITIEPVEGAGAIPTGEQVLNGSLHSQ